MNLKAVLFDKDGVITDTEPIVYENTKLVLGKLGKKMLPYDEYRTFSGVKSEDFVAKIIERFGINITVEEFRALRRELAGDVFDRVPRVEGAIEFVKELRKTGILTGIGTGASRKVTIQTLGEEISLFDVIVTADDVVFGKPHPDTWLKGAKKLGVDPRECVVVGDSKNDMLSAKEANMKRIFLSREGNSSTEGVDLTIHSFDELTVEKLKAL